jgi:shikimate kinase
MRIVIVGPCGVGKTTISEILAKNAGVPYQDFDKIRAADIKQRRGRPSPCSVSRLNMRECIPPILDRCINGFILDLGGDTIFRRNVDNEDRLQQMIWLKQTYHALIVVLTADKTELLTRFLSTKNRSPADFTDPWLDWHEIAEAYWQRCADSLIDTTNLGLNEWRRQGAVLLRCHL